MTFIASIIDKRTTDNINDTKILCGSRWLYSIGISEIHQEIFRVLLMLNSLLCTRWAARLCLRVCFALLGAQPVSYRCLKSQTCSHKLRAHTHTPHVNLLQSEYRRLEKKIFQRCMYVVCILCLGVLCI